MCIIFCSYQALSIDYLNDLYNNPVICTRQKLFAHSISKEIEAWKGDVIAKIPSLIRSRAKTEYRLSDAKTCALST